MAKQYPIGRSNDRNPYVKVEMRAARLERSNKRAAKAEEVGMLTHGLGDDLPYAKSGKQSHEHEAGWLCRELRSHGDHVERDADAWSWDPTRPVAGQYEEQAKASTSATSWGPPPILGALDPGEDAMRDPGVTERNAKIVATQTRHDIAASVARHDRAEESAAAARDTEDAQHAEALAFGDVEVEIVVGNEPDRPAGWGRDLDAIEAEHTRRAEPDCRDEDEPITGEHTVDCDKQTDGALPCNCKPQPTVCDRQATNERDANDTNFCVGDDHSTHCPVATDGRFDDGGDS